MSDLAPYPTNVSERRFSQNRAEGVHPRDPQVAHGRARSYDMPSSALADRPVAPRLAAHLVGEVAVVLRAEGAASEAEASRLLTGYAGAPHTEWAERGLAVACAGAAEIAVHEDLVVVVDGRLDNPRELAALACMPAGGSTAELLARCWRRLGERTVDLLVGDLAGVVVDRRSLCLHAFRDLCAGRPLHVTKHGRGWAAASEWQALVEVSGRGRTPSREWFAAAFVGHSLDPRVTPYDGIHMVLPGHVAQPSQDGWRQVSVARWHVPHLHNRREGAYREQFRDLFDEAVRCRVGLERVGFALSGGHDSTSVLASAYAVDPRADRVALCVPMQEPAGDERVMQAHMAERTESELRWVDISRSGPLGSDGPESVLDRFGAPPLTINWFFGDALAREAQAAGVPVVLDGEDGDGSVGGSKAYLADLLVTGRWSTWIREVNALRAVKHGSGRELLRDSVFLSAPPAWRRAYLHRVGVSIAPEVVASALRDEVQLEDRLSRSYLNRGWAPGRVFRMAQGEVGLPDHLGPTLTTISEPFRRLGISLTHPWSDRRLMSFCMGLPYVHVQRGGLTKIVLRQAMEGRLPGGLLVHRGKADLSEVVNRAVQGPERPYIEEGLRLARSQPEWFDGSAVDTIEADFRSGKLPSGAIRVAMFASWVRWCNAG